MRPLFMTFSSLILTLLLCLVQSVALHQDADAARRRSMSCSAVACDFSTTVTLLPTFTVMRHPIPVLLALTPRLLFLSSQQKVRYCTVCRTVHTLTALQETSHYLCFFFHFVQQSLKPTFFNRLVPAFFHYLTFVSWSVTDCGHVILDQI